jgi:hypothetical protein
MATSLTFTATPFVSASTLASASQFTPITIAQGGPSGSRIHGISVYTNSTTATGYFHLAFSSSAGIANLTTVPVVANAGNTTVASADVFGAAAAASLLQKQKDANGVPYFNIPANTFLIWDASGSVTTQMTSGATHTVTTFGEFY